MNDLWFYSRRDPHDAQGFRRIQVSESVHPYAGAWFPAGHPLGFGDSFVHEVYDFLNAIADGQPASPSFHDGLKCQEILAAVDRSVEERRWVKVAEM
jgi:predicted dehydrogenase